MDTNARIDTLISAMENLEKRLTDLQGENIGIRLIAAYSLARIPHENVSEYVEQMLDPKHVQWGTTKHEVLEAARVAVAKTLTKARI